MSGVFNNGHNAKCAVYNGDESGNCTTRVPPSEYKLVNAISKINNLTSKVSVLENVIIMTNERLGQLEVNNNNESCEDSISSQEGQECVVIRENAKKSLILQGFFLKLM